MPRDYKNAGKGKSAPQKQGNGVLPFLTGLSVGIIISLILFISVDFSSYQPFRAARDDNSQDKQPSNSTPANEKEQDKLTVPTFDFYNILPNKEINISEWVAEEPDIPDTSSKRDDNVYLLQVGSFRQYEAADQVKAQLALLGISADIQRVVINGQDSRYRVRVGPYKDQSLLNTERARLQENNIEFMVLKLHTDEAHGIN